ncbi:molybdopterin-dependent oxidoreductase [Sagittula stellata]|uniref:molybdopterin-dependent oxidoreductase n=1 Tax=Sagittula stellata TaxID=52603 RepID=UPI00031BB9AC|nr:molybdopterin-dependent oxidoreductase [Sagittula stellata]
MLGKRIVDCARIFLAIVVIGSAGHAQELPQPEGPVLLTVIGDMPVTNASGRAEFDREMLEDLGMREVETSTIWTDGTQVFAGPPLKAIMDRLQAKGSTLRAVAVNDYAIEIPFSDVSDDTAILAIERNGEPMSVREKGPLWVIYPYDSDQRFRTETYHSRSIWQLDTIEVLP